MPALLTICFLDNSLLLVDPLSAVPDDDPALSSANMGRRGWSLDVMLATDLSTTLSLAVLQIYCTIYIKLHVVVEKITTAACYWDKAKNSGLWIGIVSETVNIVFNCSLINDCQMAHHSQLFP